MGVDNMHKEKRFPISLTNEGVIVLKESSNKHTSGKDIRFMLSYALNSDLQLIEPCLDVENSLVDLTSFANSTGVSKQDVLSYVRKENISLCYLLKDLAYIAEHSLEVSDGEVVKTSVTLYLPFDVQNNGYLVCRDVSLNFPPQARKVIASKYKEYAKERV